MAQHSLTRPQTPRKRLGNLAGLLRIGLWIVAAFLLFRLVQFGLVPYLAAFATAAWGARVDMLKGRVRLWGGIRGGIIGFVAGIVVTGNFELLYLPLNLVLALAIGATIGIVVAEFALLVRGR